MFEDGTESVHHGTVMQKYILQNDYGNSLYICLKLILHSRQNLAQSLKQVLTGLFNMWREIALALIGILSMVIRISIWNLP